MTRQIVTGCLTIASRAFVGVTSGGDHHSSPAHDLYRAPHRTAPRHYPHLRWSASLALLAATLIGALATINALADGPTQLVSINSAGNGSGNSSSYSWPAVSSDGRYVAFNSGASDLVANDTNDNFADIFVRDMQAGTTQLVSVNSAGTGSGNGISQYPTISGDGRYVAFYSQASDLIANDTNGGVADIFVRDMHAGTTTLVSVNSAGSGGGNNNSYYATISANGRHVAFSSDAGDLVTNDTNGSVADVFVRDLQTGTTTLVSVNSAGTGGGNNYSWYSAINADGRYVAFRSDASDLVANDTNSSSDVFVRDLQANTTVLVSINSAGTASGNGPSTERSAISSDGRYVAFQSNASDLIADDTNGSVADVFVRDMQTGTATLVSVSNTGGGSNGASYDPAISGDGRFVAFDSFASNLITDGPQSGTNPYANTLARDLQSGTTRLVSVNSAGTGGGDGGSYYPAISADGQYVVFSSDASNLVGSDTNGFRDTFMRNIAPEPGPSQLQFSAASYSVAEDGGSATIAVTRLGDLSGTVTADYATGDGAATAGADYTSASGTLTFAPNETSKTFTVAITNDTLVESSETINLTLSNPTGGATLESPSTAVLTITDNDANPGTLQFSAGSYSVGEAVGSASVVVTRTGGSNGAVSVTFATSDGTATAGSDYTANTQSVTFADGDTANKTVNIPITNDTATESNEIINLTLSNPTGGASLGAPATAVLTITDDDAQLSLSINDVTVSERNRTAVFTVSLSAANTRTVTVRYETANGTAGRNDYSRRTGTLRFSPGQTSKTVSVGIESDSIDEGNETFFVNLSRPSGAIIADGQGVCTILDDDN